MADSDSPKCITRDTEICESIAIIRKHIAVVWAAACKLLNFASVILAVIVWLCVIHGCEVGRSDLSKGCH